MNIEIIKELLDGSGALAYEVTDTRVSALEFYFIGGRLDQNRIRETETIALTVYTHLSRGKEIGKASGEIPVSADKDEAKKEIERLIENAGYSPNPYYELHGPLDALPRENAGSDESPGADENASSDESHGSDKNASSAEAYAYADTGSLEERAKTILNTLKSVDATETEYINSFELFVENKERRIINSNGLDVRSVYPASMLEIVINAKKDDDEIELYRMYNFGSISEELLKKRILKTFCYGRDRLKAAPLPALNKADVLFTSEAAKVIYDYFLSRTSARYRHIGYSSLKEGKEIARSAGGDRINVTALSSLEGSSANTVYDPEGALMYDRVLIKDGVMKGGCGSRQFSFYMNESGNYIPENVRYDGGTMTEEELEGRTYLEAVEFSDFQTDPITGDIAGELRLGYLHEGDKVTVVTGGSVSGNMKDFIPSMRMSKELEQSDNVSYPAFTLLKNVTIAGAE